MEIVHQLMHRVIGISFISVKKYFIRELLEEWRKI